MPFYLSLSFLICFLVPKGSKWGWKSAPGAEIPDRLPEGQYLVCVPNLLLSQWQEEGMRFMDNRVWSFLQYPSSANQVKNFWKAWTQKGLDDPSNRGTVVVFVSHQVSLVLF